MSKTWSTKRRILSLVSSGAKTPLEISRTLNLAPSTISEHIEGLERIGAIRRIENPYVRKWKYYEKNPNFDMSSISGARRIGPVPGLAAGLAAVAAMAFIIALALASSAAPAGKLITFRLTDPPVVPNGTTHLNITYSSMAALVTNSTGSAWVYSAGSGTIDLMSLINTSQVIGTDVLRANDVISAVRFNITSAEMAVNGVVDPVTVPDRTLTVNVTGNGTVTSNSSVLIDMSPTVVSIFTSNSTVFVLVPSAKAVFVGNADVPQGIGIKSAVGAHERNSLADAAPDISIGSESLSVSGNGTRLALTIKNDGNQSVVLGHVTLVGSTSVFVSVNASVNVTVNMSGAVGGIAHWFGLSAPLAMGAAAPDNSPDIVSNTPGTHGHDGGSGPVNDSATGNIGSEIGGVDGDIASGGIANVSVDVPAGAAAVTRSSGQAQDTSGGDGIERVDEGGGLQLVIHRGVESRANSSSQPRANATGGTQDAEEVRSIVSVGREITSFRTLNFVVSGSGGLELPAVTGGMGGDAGYALPAGGSITLTFDGRIEYANGNILIVPKPGDTYRVVVSGEDGAYAAANVIAA